MKGKIIDTLVKKEWSDSDVDKYVGAYESAHLTYANDQNIRSTAASGGTTSALLIEGLERGDFEGAVVCNTVVKDGKVRAHFGIARNRSEVLAARGSKYVQTRFMSEVVPLIRSFNGRVAVLGLPCDLTALKRQCQKKADLNDKVALTVALVCGHNSRTELIDEVTRRIEKESGSEIVDYRFRVGHWRGRLEADLSDGRTISKPTKFFNDYQNLFFFSERKCMACHDHYGYDADLSAGDVWLYELKSNPIKHTGIIARSGSGKSAMENAIHSGAIHSKPMDVKGIMDGQSRIGPSHYNVSARHKAGKLLGLKLKDTTQEKVKWHSYINALISIGNMKLSETKLGRKIIFRMPRPILKFYLYIKKGLETLR